WDRLGRGPRPHRRGRSRGDHRGRCPLRRCVGLGTSHAACSRRRAAVLDL
ncbi:MAG: hypothetical protein AVDCRST_MAG55-1380, partial [uncultured Rubrobacteraceae bacterium]